MKPVVLALVLLLLATGLVPALALAAETRLLNVPYRTQLDGNPYEQADCGPAVMAMVLGAYGIDRPTVSLRGIVNDLQRTGGVYGSGTFVENLAVVAERHGLRPYGLFVNQPERHPLRRDLKTDLGKLNRWTLDGLRTALDAGHPVVAQVWYRGLPGREKHSYNGDHYIVITGYLGDQFLHNDPVDRDAPGHSKRISTAQLERAWRKSQFPFAGLAVAGSAERPAVSPVGPANLQRGILRRVEAAPIGPRYGAARFVFAV